MKKKAITLLLSLVLASGSIGNVQVLAADTTEQEAEPAQEEETYEQEEEPAQEELAEEADTENASKDVSELEEEEEPVQENEEQVQEDEDSETEKTTDEEEADISEDAAAEILETEETEITDESEDALADVVDSGYCGNEVTWTLTGTGSDLTLTFRGIGPMYDFWESDTPWASYRAKIKRVVVAEDVTTIGDYAFYSLNKVTDVSLTEALEYIGSSAFADCQALKSIEIPRNVTYICDEAFSGCRGLKSVTLNDFLHKIGYSAFSGCSGLTEIDIPESVSNIEPYAFSECSSLTSIFIPYGIKEVRENTFSGCSSLSSITIPENVTRIEYDAFADCSNLSRINLYDIGSWAQIDFDGDTGIHGDLYYNGKLLTEIVIPYGTTAITEGPFSGITSIKSVTIPDSVTSIGDRAFYGCRSLSKINIPNSVKNIGDEVFENCDSLKSLPIPDSVKSIGYLPRGYWDTNDFVIFTHNSYVKGFCKENGYVYFDKTAPSIAKLTSYNGSDIRVYFEKRDEAIDLTDYYSEGEFILGYQIKYADNKNMTGAKSIMLKDKKAASKVITGLKNGKTYYVQIQHYLKSGKVSYWSKWSPVKSVTVGQTPYPTNVSKLSTYIGSHIKVDWTKTAGASGYHIKYADNSSMTGAKEVMVKGNSTFTKTLTGLKNGKTYYVKIQTYRTVSGKTYWSSWSPAKSIKVDQIPYGSSIKDLTRVSSTKMKVTWDKAPSASGYHIQYRWYNVKNDKYVTKDIIINGNGTVSTTITGLSSNIDCYEVRIQTFRKISGKTYWSSWSKYKYGCVW